MQLDYLSKSNLSHLWLFMEIVIGTIHKNLIKRNLNQITLLIGLFTFMSPITDLNAQQLTFDFDDELTRSVDYRDLDRLGDGLTFTETGILFNFSVVEDADNFGLLYYDPGTLNGVSGFLYGEAETSGLPTILPPGDTFRLAPADAKTILSGTYTDPLTLLFGSTKGVWEVRFHMSGGGEQLYTIGNENRGVDGDLTTKTETTRIALAGSFTHITFNSTSYPTVGHAPSFQLDQMVAVNGTVDEGQVVDFGTGLSYNWNELENLFVINMDGDIKTVELETASFGILPSGPNSLATKDEDETKTNEVNPTDNYNLDFDLSYDINGDISASISMDFTQTVLNKYWENGDYKYNKGFYEALDCTFRFTLEDNSVVEEPYRVVFTMGPRTGGSQQANGDGANNIILISRVKDSETNEWNTHNENRKIDVQASQGGDDIIFSDNDASDSGDIWVMPGVNARIVGSINSETTISFNTGSPKYESVEVTLGEPGVQTTAFMYSDDEVHDTGTKLGELYLTNVTGAAASRSGGSVLVGNNQRNRFYSYNNGTGNKHDEFYGMGGDDSMGGDKKASQWVDGGEGNDMFDSHWDARNGYILVDFELTEDKDPGGTDPEIPDGPGWVEVNYEVADAVTDYLYSVESITGGYRGNGDTMKGDEHANIFLGKGGEDTLLGRDGDDTLIVDELYVTGDNYSGGFNFLQVDGGAGFDKIWLNGDSTPIDFSALTGLVTNIEKIDLSQLWTSHMRDLLIDSSDYTNRWNAGRELQLTAADVFAMTDDDNVLFVDGNDDDMVSFDDSCWYLESNSDEPGYDKYINPNAGEMVIVYVLDRMTTIITNPDNSPPVVSCVSPFTVQLDETGKIIITAEDIDNGSTDNCGIALVSINKSTFVCTNLGENIITLTVKDHSGNTNTCTTIVTIEGEDTIPPTLTCPVDVLISSDAGSCEAILVLEDPETADNCGVNTINNNAPETFPLGETIVFWTVTDTSGNIATCEQTVIVEDHELPILVCPEPVLVSADTGSCVATLLLEVPEYSDNCDGAIITNNAPETFPLGDTIVVWTVTDASENEVNCEQVITVEDTEVPIINITTGFTLQLDENGEATLTVEDIDNGSTDNCGIANLTLDLTSFDCSNLGEHTVTLTVTDESENQAMATTKVIVEDNIAPIITCLSDISVSTDAGSCEATLILETPVTTDNCEVATVSNDAPVVFPAGETTVVWTAIDSSGNSTSCEQVITVEDTEAPEAICVASFTLQLGDSGTATITAKDIDNQSIDNCGGDVTLNLDKNSFDCSDIGENNIELTVTDESGNSATCTTTVIVEDNEAPVVITQNISVALDSNGNAEITVADIDDGSYDSCGIATMSLDQTNFACPSLDGHQVILTLTDYAGNSASDTATVTFTAPDQDGDDIADACDDDIDGDGIANDDDNCSTTANPSQADLDRNGIGDVCEQAKSLSQLTIPKGISPNGDGINDTFVIGGLQNYPNNSIEFYNRRGNLVYEAKNYQNDWDGVAFGKGETLPAAPYFYVINILGDSSEIIKGWVYINY